MKGFNNYTEREEFSIFKKFFLDHGRCKEMKKKEYFADYEGEGPVLHALSVTKAKQPKEPVISFT